MNLVSCDSCGIVLDLNKIIKPSIYDNEGRINPETSLWISRDDVVSAIKCPVCGEKIPERKE